MCYNTSLDREAKELERRYNKIMWEEIRGWRPRFHASGFARPLWPVITVENPEGIQGYKWGLLPTWATDEKMALQTLNARSETMFTKNSFRSAAKAGRRCLIPATGGFESMTVGKTKIPHYFQLKGRPIFSFAGLYENGTFTMLTTKANELFAVIHNAPAASEDLRMPVIIPQAYEGDWLQPGLTTEDVMRFCVPYPADDMEAWPVGSFANQAKAERNVPAVLEPVGQAIAPRSN